MPNRRPKIGLALSGGSGRAIAHIGVLEVFQEMGIPIDYIAAHSSATLVAASYASGTVSELKREFLSIDREYFFKNLYFDWNGGGVFDLEKSEAVIQKFTLGKKFEDVKPMLNFVASDIQTGEPVSLCLGDLAKAARASCSVPFLFSPVRWGNRILVDGGLFSWIPVDQARAMGADIVIGVDIAATRHILKKRYINVWRGYSFLKNSFLFRIFSRTFSLFNRFYENSIKIVFYNQSDFFEEELVERSPDLFTVLGRAMDIASRQHQKAIVPNCDVMLSPNVKHFGKLGTENSREIYLEGRRVALEAIPEIERAIRDFNWRSRAGLRLKTKLAKDLIHD